MLIRRLVIASLIAGAASAHAGTIPAQSSSPSKVVSGWTTGNGIDVLGSGVLHGSMNLVAGVSHSADASLADILYGKVAGSVQQVDGQTKLLFQRGIEANYLLASGHGILAATAGPGKSVVGSADGAIISDGVKNAPGLSGGGSQNTSSGSTGGNTSTGGNATAPSGGNPSGNTPSKTDSTNNAGGNGAQNPAAGNQDGEPGIPASDNVIGKPSKPSAIIDVGAGIGVDIGGGEADQVAEVPEPSSIALMLLGLVGAGAMSRRRSR